MSQDSSLLMDIGSHLSSLKYYEVHRSQDLIIEKILVSLQVSLPHYMQQNLEPDPYKESYRFPYEAMHGSVVYIF